jgi:transposase-like protein
MPQKSDPSLVEEFRKHIAAQKKSGLSIGRYCKKHGITQHRFYYWKRKLRERAEADSFENTASPEAASDLNGEFIPVRVVDDRAASSVPNCAADNVDKSRIEIRLPNGVEIILSRDAYDTFDSIIASLERISC